VRARCAELDSGVGDGGCLDGLAGDEHATLDAAVDQYERALSSREAGDDDAAFALIETALAKIEELFSEEAAIARARFAITRAEIATRTRSLDEAIAMASDAVDRAHRVRKSEPMVEASALYMLGKAERPSRAHRYGAASFERSLGVWRKVVGEDSPYTLDAARALATACIKNAEWQRALSALELAIEYAPEAGHYLQRSIVQERLGAVDEARRDLDRWLASAGARPVDEQVRGSLAASRLASTTGSARTASAELARAHELAKQLPDDPNRRASLLEGSAWLYAVATDPPWFLASEVLMRRAAALAWSPELADTAWRIATAWRYGVAEELVQPAFAVLDVEACLQVWDASASIYVERPKHQQLQLLVGGAPTTIERLADDRWRDLCVQRMFSTFHAEQFKGHEPNFVAPVRSRTLLVPPKHVLELLPSLRVPKWATTSTAMISSLGEVELTRVAELAVLATRALSNDEAIAAVQRALPSLGRDVAREMLDAPKDIVLSPAMAIPLIPTA